MVCKLHLTIVLNVTGGLSEPVNLLIPVPTKFKTGSAKKPTKSNGDWTTPANPLPKSFNFSVSYLSAKPILSKKLLSF